MIKSLAIILHKCMCTLFQSTFLTTYLFVCSRTMPGCAAVNCSNSAKKGFLMKYFPKDPERRRQWLIKTRRDNWQPTDYSCLCEVSMNIFLHLGTGKKNSMIYFIPNYTVIFFTF